MKALEEIQEILRREKPTLSEKYGVKKIGIFGSCKGRAETANRIF